MNAPAGAKTVRVIRVFVSSPGDVAAERGVLNEVVERINLTDGLARGVRLELWTWEQNVVPQIGPRPQAVVDAQMPPYDIYLGILSTRFGTPTGHYGSGTQKEFNDALKKWRTAGEPWILFYFDAAPKLTGDPGQAEQYVKVCKFRKSLEQRKRGLYDSYTGVRGSSGALFEKADLHLRKIVQQLFPLPVGPLPSRPPDPTVYLRELLEQTAYIDIRGLSVGTGRAHRFPIEQLFISLTTSRGPGESRRRAAAGRPELGDEAVGELGDARSVPLHEALQNDRLIVVGDPGSGKTTFLNRVAQCLCQTQLGTASGAAREQLGIADRTFPVLVKLSELAQHLARPTYPVPAPGNATAPAWLPHYLATASAEQGGNLTLDFFCAQLKAGLCTVLLDGLDEAPDRVSRQRLSKIIESAARTYGKCRFVVTSRPSSYTSEVGLPGFEHATINPLSDEVVETFLTRWCEALYGDNREAARRHLDELLGCVRARAEIRRMARNPVMLTALAVVHWNERRLPEQRAYLYDSIITWLSRSREQRPGRATAEQTVVLLQELALAMQAPPPLKPEAPASGPDSAPRLSRVPKHWGAERIAGKVLEIAGEPAAVTPESIARAERFLDEEEVDSGIIVGRGKEVTFWHLTFQEFLAAKAITSRLDAQQREILFTSPDRVYQAEWREVILLLAGILHEQGRPKVDGFMTAILGTLRPDADLAGQARCVGLVDSVLRDLGPLKYQVSDDRYQRLLTAAMAIFDRQGSAGVALETRIAAADALGQAGDPRIDFRRDDYWVTIPASRFLMGAQSKDPKQPNYDKDASDGESPVHEVSLDAFRIARYPVTVGQFRHFVEDDGYQTPRWWQAGGFGETKELDGWSDQLQYPSRPVVKVSWYEAAAFCAWAGFRLPTEAEWERAARGTTGRKYPWGDEDIDASRANFAPDWKANVGHPTPVGIYPTGSTPEGICDLAGNVWEWCLDAYGEYPAAAVSNPHGSAQAGLRVIRGGSWRGNAGSCRAAYRDGDGPRYRAGDLGLRLAAVPQAKFLPGLEPSEAEPGAQAEPAHAERSGAGPDRAEA